MLFENVRADINELAKWNTSPSFKGKLQLIFDAGAHAVLTYRLGYRKIPIVTSGYETSQDTQTWLHLPAK